MTKIEAEDLARVIKHTMQNWGHRTLKAIHVMPKITEGVINIRVFSVPKSPEEPVPFIFNVEEL